MEDWDACEAGDPAALRKMREYNERDVLLGESLYLYLRPWDKSHPNMGLYYETSTPRCKNCGSTDLVIDEIDTVETTANSYFCWVCVNCGANGRTPVSARYGTDKLDREENKDKRLALMR